MVDMDINRATHPAMDIAKAVMANQVTVTVSPAMGTANRLMDTAATVNLVMDINASIKSKR